MDWNTELEKAGKEIKSQSEEFSPFTLGVHHVSTPKDREILIVGVNKEEKEALDIFREWDEKWSDRLRRVEESEMEEEKTTVLTYIMQSEES